MTINLNSMRFRIIITLLLVSLIPLVVLGYLSLQSSTNIISDQAETLTEQLTIESNKLVNQQFGEMVQVSTMLFTNQKLFDLLSLEKSDDAYENYQRLSEIQSIMRNVTNARMDIHAVTIISESGEIISTGSGVTNDGELHKSDWFKKVIEADGRLVWFPTQNESFVEQSQRQWIYSLARSVNAFGGKEKFVFLIDVRETALTSTLKEMSLSDNATVRIVDRSGVVVSSLNEEELGTNSPSEKYTFLEETEAGSVMDGETLITYAPIETNNWFLVAETPLSAMMNDVRQIERFTWIAVISSGVIALVVSFWIGAQLARPVERMREVMKQAGEGDLTAKVHIKGKHEIAQLNESFSELIERFSAFVDSCKEAGIDLKRVADDLIKQSEQNSLTYREITEATQSIAAGADQQARESETGAELVNELLSKWHESASETRKLGQVMAETLEVSESGQSSLQALQEKNEVTEEEFRRLSEQFHTLEERVREVHGATNLIDDIMDKTKILALNAAIEAHRAGEEGRGFLVVADEVQNLSQQVLSATRTIGGSIEAIQRAMKQTWETMNLTNEAMEEQRATVKTTGEAFHKIYEQMGEAQNQLDSVLEALGVVEQFEKRMTDAIHNISAVAEQSAASTEEVAALAKEQERSSEHLTSQAQLLGKVVERLEEQLAQFRVSEDELAYDEEVTEDDLSESEWPGGLWGVDEASEVSEQEEESEQGELEELEETESVTIEETSEIVGSNEETEPMSDDTDEGTVDIEASDDENVDEQKQ